MELFSPLIDAGIFSPSWGISYGETARGSLLVTKEKSSAYFLAATHFLGEAQRALEARGSFHVALAGGQTPRPVYQLLASEAGRAAIDWSSVHLYWSDERAVPPDHPESNYRMAMSAGWSQLPLNPSHIHRMCAEGDLEKSSLTYERTLQETLPSGSFDLLLLGVGEDGHTASLFPHAEALSVEDRWVVASRSPQAPTNRMTLTYPCINRARSIVFYLLGKSKATIAHQILEENEPYPLLPAQRVTAHKKKPLWILDGEGAAHLQIQGTSR